MKKHRLFMLIFVLALSLMLTIAATAQEDKTPEEEYVDLRVAGGIKSAVEGAGIEAVAERFAFTQTLGTYTEIISGTVYGTASNDDQSFAAIDLGFTFYYDGDPYTQISIQSNGWVAMGSAIASSYYPLSTGTTNNVIAALGRDLQGNGTTSELMSLMEGTAPNRVFTIQWKHYKRYGSTYTGDDFNFQIKLYETSDLVEIVYGSFTVLYVASPPYSPQVGLRGASNSDFNNRMTDATHFWADSLAGTLNTDVMSLSDTVYPPTGLTYEWSVPPFVGLVPDYAGSTCRGDTIEYPLTAQNFATYEDTLDIAASGNTWPTTINPTSLTLANKASGNVTASVYVPWAATLGSQDVVTVTATGQLSGLWDDAVITTGSALVSGYTDYANVPTGREVRAPSVVYHNGKLYKIGGYGYPGGVGGAQPWLDIYDIATDTWTSGAAMPGARYWLDCEAISDRIYCAGGYLAAGTNTLYIYDITTNTWTTGAILPANRYNYASAQLGGRYYVIGGYTAGYLATMLAYDPATDTWDSTLPSMSTARRYFMAGVIGGRIFVAGGYNGSYLSSAEVYDPVLNSWSPIASMPSTWLNAADGVVHNRFLILTGGSPSSTSGASNGALFYDAQADSWGWLPLLDHILYSAEGDGDGTDFWYASGRLYENATWSNSPYTTHLDECAACTPVSGLDFTVDPSIPRPGIPAEFEASVTAGSPAILYTWDFGDMGTGFGETALHTFAAEGAYTVTLTASNCDGATIISTTQVITAQAGAWINIDPEEFSSTQCADTTAADTLEICNAGSLNLDWSITELPVATWLAFTPASGTVTPSQCQTVDINFDSAGLTPGAYTTTLQLASNDIIDPLLVIPVDLIVAGALTNVDFTWDPLSPNLNQDVTFTGQATALLPVDYNWDFGDGITGTNQVTTHAYSTWGTFTTTMTAEQCGYQEVVTHTLNVASCWSLLNEDFEGAFPPSGWTVQNNGGTCDWQRNDFWATPRPNYAGGEGFCADADSDKCGSGTTMDTELRTMTLDLSTVTTATLSYITSYNDIATAGDYGDVDISTDGGLNWVNLVHWDADHSPNGPGEAVALNLTPYVGSSNVMLRFHYYLATYDWWYEVDQVNVLGCYVPGAEPDIVVAPLALTQTLLHEQTADQLLNIANEGLAGLDWEIDEGCGTPVSWLSVNPISGTLPAASNTDVTVSFDSTGLASGTYNTSLCVVSNDPDEPSIPVAVTLIVTPTPDIAVDAPPLEAVLPTATTEVITFTICNNGDAPLTWDLEENALGLKLISVTGDPVNAPAPELPVVTSEAQCLAYANFTGLEPLGYAEFCMQGFIPPQASASIPLAPTDIGYAQDIGYISDNFVTFTLNNFSGQTVVGTNANAYYGMDFDPTATVLYALNDTTDQLGVIDLTTGIFTGLVPCLPGGGAANWTGLSIDPVTGVFYGSTATDLFIIDPTTGNSTLVGAFGTTTMIEIAMGPNGDMYGHDITSDSIYQIDPTTGATTLIGPTGYAANYAQGMDFDNDDGTLYIFLYIGSGANVYGTVDLTTGAVTPLSTSPLGEFEGATQTTVPGANDIPWLSEEPITGTLPAGQCAVVDVTFDSDALELGTYTGDLNLNSNDPDTSKIILPVTMTVVEPSLVMFNYFDLEDVVQTGEDVTIIGDFNGWGTDPITMTPNVDYSVFTATALIYPGTYTYKYFMPDLPDWSNYDMLNTGNRTLDVSGDITVTEYRDVDVGWAHLGDPVAITITLGENSGNLVGEVYVQNVTTPVGEGRSIAAELGYGVDPNPATWTWVDLVYTGDNYNNDLLAAVITPTAVGTYTYGVRFDGNWGTGNPNAGWTNGDRTGLMVVLSPSADLEVTKDAPAEVIAGDTFTYTVMVTNNGPDDAIGVEVVDILPDGVTFVSASAGCVEASGVVTCDVGDLAADGSITLYIVVTAPAQAGTITNTVVVSSEATDPDPSNNSASVDVEVGPLVTERFVYLPLMYKVAGSTP
jgi:uncharacterized repeat protein (TIGR01451 family)